MTDDLKAHAAAEVLNRAADLIAPDGMWGTDHYWTDPTLEPKGFCLVEALVKAHPQGRWHWNARRAWGSMVEPHCGRIGMALYEAIGPECKGFPEGLVAWNDAPGRTQAEVVGALRKAAEAIVQQAAASA